MNKAYLLGIVAASALLGATSVSAAAPTVAPAGKAAARGTQVLPAPASPRLKGSKRSLRALPLVAIAGATAAGILIIDNSDSN